MPMWSSFIPVSSRGGGVLGIPRDGAAFKRGAAAGLEKPSTDARP
jgi:hypothetical protein